MDKKNDKASNKGHPIGPVGRSGALESHIEKEGNNEG
jgi:hypothetical protein